MDASDAKKGGTRGRTISLADVARHSCTPTTRHFVAPRRSLARRQKKLNQSFPMSYQRPPGRHIVASGRRSSGQRASRSCGLLSREVADFVWSSGVTFKWRRRLVCRDSGSCEERFDEGCSGLFWVGVRLRPTHLGRTPPPSRA
jgi:hypothetical protein